MPPNARQPDTSYCPASMSPGLSFGRKSYGVPQTLQKPFSRATISHLPPHFAQRSRGVPVYSWVCPQFVHLSFVSGSSHAMPSDLVPVQKRLFSGTFASGMRFFRGSVLGMSGTVMRPSPSLRLLLSFVAFDERLDPRALAP